jgi:hypothetical protein
VTSISSENTFIFAFDGTTPATPPTDTTFQCAEQGKSSWTNAGGSAAAMFFDDISTPAITLEWFLIMSVMPTFVGAKTNKIRMSIDYY